MELTKIHGIIQATPGANVDWEDPLLPVPAGVYIYDDDSKDIRIGNSVDVFDDLDTFINIDDIVNSFIDLSKLEYDTINPADVDKLVIVKDVGGGIIKFGLSDYKYNDDIKIPLDNIETIESSQTNDLSDIIDKANRIGSITISDDDKIVTVQNGIMNVIEKTYEDNKQDVIAASMHTNTIRINNIKFFSDVSCVNEITRLVSGITYYAVIDAVDSVNTNTLIYELTCNNENTTINLLSGNKYSIIVNSDTDISIDVYGRVSNDGGDHFKYKMVTIEVLSLIARINEDNSSDNRILLSIDQFSNGDYIAVGYGSDNSDTYGFITVLSKDLTRIIEKKYTEFTDYCHFNSVKVDKDDNAIIVGEGANTSEHSSGIILKYYSGNIVLSKKVSSPNNATKFNDLVISDMNTYIVVGSTGFSISNITAYAVTFSELLIKLNSRSFSNVSANSVFNGIAKCSNNKYIAVGTTTNHDKLNGIAVKLNTDLTTDLQKVITGTDYIHFDKVITDSSGTDDQFIISGYNAVDSQSIKDALVVKLSNTLIVANAITISGIDADAFYDVKINRDGNYVFVGSTKSEINNGTDNVRAGIFYTISKQLDSIIEQKLMTNTTQEAVINHSVIIDDDNNIIIVGEVVKSFQTKDIVYLLNSNIPDGNFSSIPLDILYNDSSLSLNTYNFGNIFVDLEDDANIIISINDIAKTLLMVTIDQIIDTIQ